MVDGVTSPVRGASDSTILTLHPHHLLTFTDPIGQSRRLASTDQQPPELIRLPAVLSTIHDSARSRHLISTSLRPETLTDDGQGENGQGESTASGESSMVS